MPYSNVQKTRLLLGDPVGVMGLDRSELTGHLDRGGRDMARRGLLVQKQEVIDLTAATRTYTLVSDHVDTFTIFRERYQVSARLLSQDAAVWWLTVSTTGVLALQDTNAPAGHVLLPTDTYWLELQSPDATTWYLYPSPIGTLVASTTEPSVGTGTSSTLQLRDNLGTPWYLAVSDMGGISVSQTGTATLTADALDDHAMQRVEPEAISRIAPRASPAAPERYAISGKLLYVDPAPDVAYQLLHYYFADDVNSVPNVAQYLPVMFATAMGLQRTQRLIPAQEVLAMYRIELDVLAQNLYPGSRDGLSVYRMPDER